MGKLLRVLVVILFILGIAALVLGIQLFQKRETLRGHAETFADLVLKVTPFIETEQGDDLTKTDHPKMNTVITREQLLAFDPKLPADTNRADMANAMGQLIGKASSQYAILNDTRQALGQKIQELEVATNRIIALEGDVARLDGEKKQLQDNVATLQKDVADQKAQVESKTAELETAKVDLADMKDQRDKLKDTILDKDDEIKSLGETIKRQQEEIARLSGRTPGATNQAPTLVTQGNKGKILLVNKSWNFVVIGTTPDAGLGVGTELLIQRDDKMVGKVRVSDVNEQYQLAIGDLLMEPWKKDDPKEGDNVIY